MDNENIKYETETFNKVIGDLVPGFEEALIKALYDITKGASVQFIDKPYKSDYVIVEKRYTVKRDNNTIFYVDKMSATDNKRQSEYMVHREYPYVDIQPAITNEGAQKVFEFVEEKYNQQNSFNEKPKSKITLQSFVKEMLKAEKSNIVKDFHYKDCFVIFTKDDNFVIEKLTTNDKTEYKITNHTVNNYMVYSEAEAKQVYEMLEKEYAELQKHYDVYNMIEYFKMLEDFRNFARQ